MNMMYDASCSSATQLCEQITMCQIYSTIDVLSFRLISYDTTLSLTHGCEPWTSPTVACLYRPYNSSFSALEVPMNWNMIRNGNNALY